MICRNTVIVIIHTRRIEERNRKKIKIGEHRYISRLPILSSRNPGIYSRISLPSATLPLG